MDEFDDFPNIRLVDEMQGFSTRTRESSKKFLRSWSLHYGVQRQSRGGPSDKPDKGPQYCEQRVKTELAQIEK